MKQAVVYLKKAETLAANRVDLTTTSGNTLLKIIQDTISVYDGIDDYDITTENANELQSVIARHAVKGSTACLTPHKLSVDLLGQFVN